MLIISCLYNLYYKKQWICQLFNTLILKIIYLLCEHECTIMMRGKIDLADDDERYRSAT